MTSQNPHVTIIGAGIIGVSCAAFLQREGFRVTLVDRVPPGGGCSFGNAGGVLSCALTPTVHPAILWKIPGWLMDPTGPLRIRWSYLPRALPWLLAAGRAGLPDRVKSISDARIAISRTVHEDHRTLLAAAGAPELLVSVDGIQIYETEAEYRESEPARRLKQEHQLPVRRLSQGEVAELEPDVTRDFYAAETHGGWWHVRNPHTVVATIADQVVRDGGEILRDDVVRIVHDGNRVTTLELASGTKRAVDRLVIAAGAYSDILTRQIGTPVLLEAERGYHLTVPDPGISLSRSITLYSHPGAVSPMDVGLRIAGTDEFAGLDAEPDWRRADSLWHMGKRLLPKLRDLDGTVSRWMGRRPGMPDSLPVIGKAPKMANTWLAFGHSHMGLGWGPTTGRLLAALMAGKPTGIDMAPYRADRSFR